jgi:hypothetical protein
MARHGGVLFATWYLRQLPAYQQQTSVRLLDYFDDHWICGKMLTRAVASTASRTPNGPVGGGCPGSRTRRSRQD